MPPEVRAYIDRVDALTKVLLVQSASAEIGLLPIYSNHLVLKAAGLVELSTRAALSQYAAQRGNLQIQKFVESAVSRENALNCEKIRLLLTRMDKNWWPKIEESLKPETKSAIDSLKDLRDQIAHGNDNGTGIHVVERYYVGAKDYASTISSVLLV